MSDKPLNQYQQCSRTKFIVIKHSEEQPVTIFNLYQRKWLTVESRLWLKHMRGSTKYLPVATVMLENSPHETLRPSFSSPNVSCTDSTLALRRCNRGPGPAGPWTSRPLDQQGPGPAWSSSLRRPQSLPWLMLPQFRFRLPARAGAPEPRSCSQKLGADLCSSGSREARPAVTVCREKQMRRVNQNAGPLWGARLCSESGCVCVRMAAAAAARVLLVGSHVLTALSAVPTGGGSCCSSSGFCQRCGIAKGANWWCASLIESFDSRDFALTRESRLLVSCQWVDAAKKGSGNMSPLCDCNCN